MQTFTISNRAVFRTPSNIYDEAFLWKWLPTERRWSFWQKTRSLMFERILSRALGKSTTNNDNVSASINNNTNISENKNELLSIVFDSNFSFEDHIKNIWKSKSKVKGYSMYASREKKNSYESICNIAICILSICLDFSWQRHVIINSLHDKALRVTSYYNLDLKTSL